MLISPKFSRILGLLPFLSLIFSCSSQNQFVGQVENHPKFEIPAKNKRIGMLPIVKSEWKVLSPCDSCFGLSQNQMEFGFYGDVDSLFRFNGLEVVDSWVLQPDRDSQGVAVDSVNTPDWLKGEYQNHRVDLFQKLPNNESTRVQNLLSEYGLDYIFEPYLVGCQIKGKGRRQGERTCKWDMIIYQNKLLPFVGWVGRFEAYEEFFLEGDIDRNYHHEFITWLSQVWKEESKDVYIELEEMSEEE